MSSWLHELPITHFSTVCHSAMYRQRETCSNELEACGIHVNILTLWTESAQFTADLSLCVNNSAHIFIEVAVLQSRRNVQDKVTQQLLLPDTIGVVVIHLHELSAFSYPDLSSNGTFMTCLTKGEWAEEVRWVKNANHDAFAGIYINGVHWIYAITCTIELHTKTTGKAFEVIRLIYVITLSNYQYSNCRCTCPHLGLSTHPCSALSFRNFGQNTYARLPQQATWAS